MGLISKTLIVMCIVFSGCSSNKKETWNGVAKCENCPRLLPIWRQGICPDCIDLDKPREYFVQHLYKHD